MRATWFDAVTRAVLRLVAPPRCAGCDVPLPVEALFCGKCEPGIETPARVDYLAGGLAVISTGRYDAALKEAVQRLKYRSRPDLARPLGARLGLALASATLSPDTLFVPVPLHPAKLAARGYNQAALIADAAARALGLACGPRVVQRVRGTEAQASLGRDARVENVRSAFAVREPVAGRPVLVVDDVVTTGATAIACAHALTAAGADVVAIAAVARARREDVAPLHRDALR